MKIRAKKVAAKQAKQKQDKKHKEWNEKKSKLKEQLAQLSAENAALVQQDSPLGLDTDVCCCRIHIGRNTHFQAASVQRYLPMNTELLDPKLVNHMSVK